MIEIKLYVACDGNNCEKVQGLYVDALNLKHIEAMVNDFGWQASEHEGTVFCSDCIEKQQEKEKIITVFCKGCRTEIDLTDLEIRFAAALAGDQAYRYPKGQTQEELLLLLIGNKGTLWHGIYGKCPCGSRQIKY